jgi:hypothetical protein
MPGRDFRRQDVGYTEASIVTAERNGLGAKGKRCC